MTPIATARRLRRHGKAVTATTAAAALVGIAAASMAFSVGQDGTAAAAVTGTESPAEQRSDVPVAAPVELSGPRHVADPIVGVPDTVADDDQQAGPPVSDADRPEAVEPILSTPPAAAETVAVPDDPPVADGPHAETAAPVPARPEVVPPPLTEPAADALDDVTSSIPPVVIDIVDPVTDVVEETCGADEDEPTITVLDVLGAVCPIAAPPPETAAILPDLDVSAAPEVQPVAPMHEPVPVAPIVAPVGALGR